MPAVESLISTGDDDSLNFGNYEPDEKQKLDNYEYAGDLYKVKSYRDITKLERNGAFVYESVPGTAVTHFVVTNNGVSFDVEGVKDSQITLQLDDDTEYQVYVDGVAIGNMVTNLSGKLVFSVELAEGKAQAVKFVKR